ncbi:hypothetical protein J9303_17240 [Bacillaceae bacterium Marseille-Q3522]|nr:hypothetical protein [Bacillaceae bacterium Marseille-Q3522]
MFFKKSQEEKEEITFASIEVYACSDIACNGWMRKEFATADLKCPLCGHDTSAEIRHLPKI